MKVYIVISDDLIEYGARNFIEKIFADSDDAHAYAGHLNQLEEDSGTQGCGYHVEEWMVE